MEVEAIVLDWDGIIVDVDDREFSCINKALESVGSRALSRQEYVRRYYSTPYTMAGPRLLLKGIIEDEKVAEKAIKTYNDKFSECIRLTRLQEGAFDTLEALKRQNIRLAVATLRRNRKVVEREMSLLGIGEFVDVLVTRENLEPRLQKKPIFNVIAEVRAEQFVKALTLLKKEVSKAIVVGDSWWDIRGAKKERMVSAWVKTGFGFCGHCCNFRWSFRRSKRCHASNVRFAWKTRIDCLRNCNQARKTNNSSPNR